MPFDASGGYTDEFNNYSPAIGGGVSTPATTTPSGVQQAGGYEWDPSGTGGVRPISAPAKPSTPSAAPVIAPHAGGLPVSMSGLLAATNLNSPGSSPVATGFPLLDQMLDNLLRTRADARADRQQQIDLVRLLTELDRVSPTRAAGIAAGLGIDGAGAGLAVSNLFGTGKGFPQAGGGRVSGNIGGQDISLPSVFSGHELSFLGANPNVAHVLSDIGDYLGKPDILQQSQAARIPTMANILSGGI